MGNNVILFKIVLSKMEALLPYDPSCPSVRWFVGWSVCHNVIKGLEVTLPCSF